MLKRGFALLAGLALAAVAAASAPARSTGVGITGAGSSFVFPLVSTWTPALDSAFGYQVTYGSVGSGAGIQAITSRTVDFGASDAPMTPELPRAPIPVGKLTCVETPTFDLNSGLTLER